LAATCFCAMSSRTLDLVFDHQFNADFNSLAISVLSAYHGLSTENLAILNKIQSATIHTCRHWLCSNGQEPKPQIREPISSPLMVAASRRTDTKKAGCSELNVTNCKQRYSAEAQPNTWLESFPESYCGNSLYRPQYPSNYKEARPTYSESVQPTWLMHQGMAP
jgi:hypothetical protein